MTTAQIVEIKEKSVYGNTLLYPNNEIAKIFAKLVNKQTFSRKDLGTIADLGYKVEIINL
jgi:hypothetical protein